MNKLNTWASNLLTPSAFRLLGLGMIMAGITRWSLSLGLIVGGLYLMAVAQLAEEPEKK